MLSDQPSYWKPDRKEIRAGNSKSRSTKKEARVTAVGFRSSPSGGGKEEDEDSEADDEDGKHCRCDQSSGPREVSIVQSSKIDLPALSVQIEDEKKEEWTSNRKYRAVKKEVRVADSEMHRAPSGRCKKEEEGSDLVKDEGRCRKLGQASGLRKDSFKHPSNIDHRKAGTSDAIIFVGNLPYKASVNWLRAIFQKIGLVVDVFIPNRLSKGYERKYGFVRFVSEGDAERAIRNFDGIPVGKWNLIVQRAKPRSVGVVSKGHGSKSSTSSVSFCSSFSSEPTASGVYRQGFKTSGSKKRAAGMSKGTDWFQCAALAYLRRGKSFLDMRSGILEAYPFVKSISLIKSISVLIVFQSSFHRGWAIEQGLWSQWFNSMEVWEENKLRNDNHIWVECVGIPYWAWNNVTFKAIANIWGALIEVDSETSDMIQVASARLCISTSVLEIDEFIDLEVDGRLFDIRVSSFTDQEISCNNQSASWGRGNNLRQPKDCNPMLVKEGQQTGQMHPEANHKNVGQMDHSMKLVNQRCVSISCSPDGTLNISGNQNMLCSNNLISDAYSPDISVVVHGSETVCIFGKSPTEGKIWIKHNCCRSSSEVERDPFKCSLNQVSVAQEEQEGYDPSGCAKVRNTIGVSGSNSSVNSFTFSNSGRGSRVQAEKCSFRADDNLMFSEHEVAENKQLGGFSGLVTECKEDKSKKDLSGTEMNFQYPVLSENQGHSFNISDDISILVPNSSVVKADLHGLLNDEGVILRQKSDVKGTRGNEFPVWCKDSASANRDQIEFERAQFVEEPLSSGLEETSLMQSAIEGNHGAVSEIRARKDTEFSRADKVSSTSDQFGINGQVPIVGDQYGHRDSSTCGKSEASVGEFGSHPEFNIDVFDTAIIKAIEDNSDNEADQAIRGDSVKVEVGWDEVIPKIPKCSFEVTKEFLISSIDITTDVLVECKDCGISISEKEQRAIIKAMAKRHIQAEIDFYAESKNGE